MTQAQPTPHPGPVHKQGTVAERTLALLRKAGTGMKSGDIARGIGAKNTAIAASLQPLVKSGELVVCKVMLPSGQETTEYRVAAGGRPMDFTPLKQGNAARRSGDGIKLTEAQRSWHVAGLESARKEMTSADSELLAKMADMPSAQTLPLSNDVPNPGRRFGKGTIVSATLRQMKGDESFLVDDGGPVYTLAKNIGVKITTRQEGKRVRVWRVE